MSEKKGNESPFLDSRIGQMPERIREAMNDQSVRGFAQKADITEGTLRNILNGGIPRLDSVLRIADAGGVNIGWLVSGEGPMMKGDLPTAISFKQIRELDDEATTESCIVIREAEDALGLRLNGKQFAKVLYHAYNYSIEQDYALPDEAVRMMVQGASEKHKSYSDNEVRRRPYGQTRHYKSDEI